MNEAPPPRQAEASIEPVVRSVVVRATPARAFAAFTADIGRWWPKAHSIHEGSPQAAVVIEPFVRGRWYERAEDGSESEWGYVLDWQPPHRVVLAWQLDAQWRYEPTLVTEVELTFTALGEGRTAIRLEHRRLERYGALAGTVRGQVGGEQGWGALLALCAAVAERD